MKFYNNLIKIFTEMKQSGVSKEDAPNCLEFDSDYCPSLDLIQSALNHVYGS